MPEYRRIYTPGGIYFFTLVTYQRKKIFSQPCARSLFSDAVSHVRKYQPLTTIAHCILPDHIHLIWQMPEDNFDYSKRIGAIKRHFSIKYCEQFNIHPPQNKTMIKRREVAIWQRRFWEHSIFDENDFEHHLNYLHFNPVKHGLVDRVQDWEASSFKDFVKQGYYDLDWGGNYRNVKPNQDFGE
ncbi:MAG: REP-associated tyrosine transposase [Brevefilum sp.]|jgi:putative transposase